MTDKDDILYAIKELNEYINEVVVGYTLYLHVEASSDIGGYRRLEADDPDAAKTDVAGVAITADAQAIDEWATEPALPALILLQHGVYELHLHAEQTAGTKTATLYFEFYKRAAGGAETLLGTSEEITVPSTDLPIDIHMNLPEQIILIDDRLVVKLIANQDGLGTNPTISVDIEGNTASRIRVPVSIGDIGGGAGIRQVPPSHYIIQDGHTAADNNVYRGAGDIVFGKTSHTANHAANIYFLLPSDYISGQNITFELYWRAHVAADVNDYEVAFYYASDGTAMALANSAHATWTSAGVNFAQNYETLTITGTNLVASGIVWVRFEMEDDNNVNASELYSSGLLVPVS